jgi:hypothetical protein
MTDYERFIASKAKVKQRCGFKSDLSQSVLFDFQRELVTWALDVGKAAIFADCGLGKSPMQLHWAREVCNHSRGRVLILTPLAVAEQTIREGKKFGIDCTRSKNGEMGEITVANYERLDKFDPNDFCGIVCDESSILKNYAGKMRQDINDFCEQIKYRLLCTATPAPNDHAELGTSCEALGVMRRVEMLAMYFSHDSGETQKWSIKGHAETPFWRFVGSWARAIRRPSDMGYEDGRFVLPEMILNQTTLKSKPLPGKLFAVEAVTLDDQRAERRDTIEERCQAVADIANATGEQYLAWCSLNDESKMLTDKIDGAVEVCGSMTDDQKADAMMAFSDGSIRCLVSKPVIAGFGMNWQNCNRMSFFPSHSHEQFYQAVRRCWRFGQQRPVTVDIVTTEAESRVIENMRRKEEEFCRMFDGIIEHMRDVAAPIVERKTVKKEIPEWLSNASTAY